MAQRFAVTDQDIACGVARSATSCPIARAARRGLGDRELYVGRNALFIGSYVYALPPVAIAFVRAFDAGEPVSALSFRVDLRRSRGRLTEMRRTS